MNKQIALCGRLVNYELTYKRVKNINLRIRGDGSVAVSANRLVSVASIESFMREKAGYILSALDRCAAAQPAPLSYADGDAVRYLGQSVKLNVVASRHNGACFNNGQICLAVKDTGNAELKKKTLEAWLSAECMRIVDQKCREIYPYFAKLGVAFPQIRYRSMTSRWGSCKPSGAALTFNKRLIAQPVECIEYVVAHEFTHFLQADHSAEFYRKLALVMPDWKARRAKLRYTQGNG